MIPNHFLVGFAKHLGRTHIHLRQRAAFIRSLLSTMRVTCACCWKARAMHRWKAGLCNKLATTQLNPRLLEQVGNVAAVETARNELKLSFSRARLCDLV